MNNSVYRSIPFPYIVRDGFLSSADLRATNDAWPDPAWPGWHHYTDLAHRKQASARDEVIPPALSVLLARLAAVQTNGFFNAPGAVPDLSFHGAGLHEMAPGTLVGLHRDAERHPRLGLARALSAVLYVHEEWSPSWGGELRLGREGEAVIEPVPGRLVVFDCRGEAWHEVMPVGCPEGKRRRSLCCFFYLPEIGKGETRARFA